ncbi:MAG: DnaJ domain-containing protein [Deltaproteobacteria bacterium]|nr:DnaJ domain-containing protein [Deltaproteobacteria bacterium]
MGWFGKVLGGAIGMAIGGPPGAIAGLAIGHGFFDKNDLDISDSNYQFTISKNDQTLFLSNLFTMYAHICVLDKKVTKRKIRYLEKFIETKLNFDIKRRNILVKYFNQALKTNPDLRLYKEFCNEFILYEDIALFTIKSLLEFSLINNEIGSEVESFLYSISKKLDVKSSFTELFNIVRQNSKSPYAILDCDENDDLKEITKQYRSLVSIYHPDKSKGSLDNFLKIQEAYEDIKKLKGTSNI